MMSEYEREESLKLGEMKFSPSYDMSKVMTTSGKFFLELKSMYHYYDFNIGGQKDNLDQLKKSKKFSVIVKTTDIDTDTDTTTTTNNNNNNNNDDEDSHLLLTSLPTIPCLLKSSNPSKVFVFIPFCELIPISE